MKFRPQARILSWRTVIWKLIGWRAVKRLPGGAWMTRRRTAQRINQNSRPPVQFIINAAKQSSAFQFIGCATKARKHDDQDQAVPDLQAPLDGFENLHSMQ